MEKLRDALVDFGHIDKINLPGLAEDRAAVIAGGAAINHGGTKHDPLVDRNRRYSAVLRQSHRGFARDFAKPVPIIGRVRARWQQTSKLRPHWDKLAPYARS